MKKIIWWLKDWYFLNFKINPNAGFWWIRTVNIGAFLDQVGSHIFHDGYTYRIDKWHRTLCKAAKLKKGDIIYNPYKGIFTNVEKVDFEWGEHNGVEYICSVVITDDLGYCIYDPEEETF